MQAGLAIRGVIWDMGGVIVRTVDYAPRTQLAERLGMTRVELEKLVFNSDSSHRAELGEISVDEHWENVRKACNLTPEEMHTVRHSFWGGDRVDHVLVRYIDALRLEHATALLSNAWTDVRNILENEWKITYAFNQVIISAEEGIRKPDARIYQLAARRLGVQPGETVFIDDIQLNVDGARAAGLQAIRFLNPEQAKADLEQLLRGNAQS